MKSRIIAALAASTLLFAACGSDDNSSDTTVAVDTTMAAEPGTIIDVASGEADLTTLVTAIYAADLGGTLSGEGPFTVFAPTNEAFAALPAGLLDKLLLVENKDVLAKILTYHVVASTVMAADITAGDVATVEGSTVAITTDGGVKVNDATVTATDIPASNGVVHLIDKVIIPPTVDLDSL